MSWDPQPDGDLGQAKNCLRAPGQRPGRRDRAAGQRTEAGNSKPVSVSRPATAPGPAKPRCLRASSTQGAPAGCTPRSATTGRPAARFGRAPPRTRCRARSGQCRSRPEFQAARQWFTWAREHAHSRAQDEWLRGRESMLHLNAGYLEWVPDNPVGMGAACAQAGSRSISNAGRFPRRVRCSGRPHARSDGDAQSMETQSQNTTSAAGPVRPRRGYCSTPLDGPLG